MDWNGKFSLLYSKMCYVSLSLSILYLFLKILNLVVKQNERGGVSDIEAW